MSTPSVPSLALSPVGPVSVGWVELAGTGDGELWGFSPAAYSLSGSAVLAQIDADGGAVLKTYTLSQLDNQLGDFAVKFFGGSFWIFLSSAVYEVDRATGNLKTPLPYSGHTVAGVGGSTCVPVQ